MLAVVCRTGTTKGARYRGPCDRLPGCRVPEIRSSPCRNFTSAGAKLARMQSELETGGAATQYPTICPTQPPTAPHLAVSMCGRHTLARSRFFRSASASWHRIPSRSEAPTKDLDDRITSVDGMKWSRAVCSMRLNTGPRTVKMRQSQATIRARETRTPTKPCSSP